MNIINLALLVDQYREDFEDPSGWAETNWPTLYRFEAAGQTWLTDRYWLLPAAMCDIAAGMQIVPLPLPAETVRLFERIERSDLVRYHVAWELAAYLAADGGQ